MANYAKIRLEFILAPAIGNQFTITFNEGGVPINRTWTFAAVRTGAYQVEVLNPVLGLVAQAAVLADALRDDLPAYTIFYQALTWVDITFKTYNSSFTVVSLPACLTATITPEVLPVVVFGITGFTAGEAATDKNNLARFYPIVENEAYPITILEPVSKVANNVGELFFDYSRQITPAQTCRLSCSAGLAERTIPLVSKFQINSVTVIPSEFSATVTINAVAISGLTTVLITPERLYSLDGVVTQESNYYTGILAGDYTAYVYDSFGGVWTYLFNVTLALTNKPEPFFDISRINSIHFTNNASYGNFFSRYERQIFTNIEYQAFAQDFKSTDVVKTQIRSSYDTITATIRNYCDSSIISTFDVTNEVTNIRKQDKRDCLLKASGAGTTYLYFTSGNIYTPDTLDIIGSFDLNSVGGLQLESWMKAGIIVELSTGLIGTYSVSQVVYVADLGYVLEIDTPFTGGVTPATCQSTYNDEDWDVYEFAAAFTGLSDGLYDIIIEASDLDVRYTDVSWISEPIKISLANKTVELKYTTLDRTILNIVPTGIEHLLRVKGNFYSYGASQTVEI